MKDRVEGKSDDSNSSLDFLVHVSLDYHDNFAQVALRGELCGNSATGYDSRLRMCMCMCVGRLIKV